MDSNPRAPIIVTGEPRRSLASTLPRMIDAMRRDPAALYREHELGEVPERAREELASTTDGACDMRTA